jgi:hypothetical protein
MPGIRFHHRYLAGVMFVIELDEPTLDPNFRHDCPTCKSTHTRNSLHIRIDATGHAMIVDGISQQNWARLMAAGFEVSNRVDHPPPVEIGAVPQPKLEIVTQTIRPADPERRAYVPAIDKNASAEVMRKPFQPLVDRELERRDRKATAKKAEKRTLFDLGKRRSK